MGPKTYIKLCLARAGLLGPDNPDSHFTQNLLLRYSLPEAIRKENQSCGAHKTGFRVDFDCLGQPPRFRRLRIIASAADFNIE